MSLTTRTGAVIERVDAAAVAAVIKLDILTLIIIRGRRSQRLKVRLLARVVWDETGGRCRIAALMEVAQVMLMLRLEVLIRVIRVVWMGLLLMVLMVLLMLLSLLLICDNATVDAAVLLLPRRVGMRGGDGGGGGGVSHFRAPGNPRSFATEGETERRSGRDLRSEIVRDRLVKMGR